MNRTLNFQSNDSLIKVIVKNEIEYQVFIIIFKYESL